ncbi:hypothetical protein RJ639_025783 [Escallonia herrerae]|uniref:RNA polymerase Rpb1 domain-containing protein n=1 Tax=Escallonia herrerae TaxID=1293975 RepID=A0AA88S841_9ASTE|nr:hypothetical protein RJ639_025783 [Escallonia herrerae]
MDKSGTSNSSVVNAEGSWSNAGDEDSCSKSTGDAFAFDFGILRVGSGRKEGENRAEFVTRQLFSVDSGGGGGGELTQEQSSRPNWVDLTFWSSRVQWWWVAGFESFTTATAAAAAASEEEPAGAAIAKLAKAKVNKVFRYELDDEKWNPNYMLPEHVEDLKTIREFRNVFDAEVQKLEAYGFQLGTEIATTGDNSWPMPMNLKRLIWNAQKTFKVDLRRSSDMHLMEIVEAVDKLQERLKVVTGDDAMSMEAQKNATLFFTILLHSTFASKRVLNEYRLTREAFDWVTVR